MKEKKRKEKKKGEEKKEAKTQQNKIRNSREMRPKKRICKQSCLSLSGKRFKLV